MTRHVLVGAYCATHASMTVGHSGTSCHGGVINYGWGHNITLRTQFAMTTTIEQFKESCHYVLDIICKEPATRLRVIERRPCELLIESQERPTR